MSVVGYSPGHIFSAARPRHTLRMEDFTVVATTCKEFVVVVLSDVIFNEGCVF